MSRRIASLLNQPQHIVKKAINKLEDKNGYPSHDVRHLADNIQKTRAKIYQLGLDPDDTTGEELYQALYIKFQGDSRLFDNYCQLNDDTFEAKANKAIDLVSTQIVLPECWVLKKNISKQLLQEHQPKKVMKQLNYRSINSLLKREDTGSLYVAAGLLESANWLKQHTKLVSKQDSASLAPRRLDLIALSINKWGELGADSPVIYCNDTGTLAIVENTSSPDMPLLSMVIELIDSLKIFKPVNLTQEVCKLSPAVSWWNDLDGLIAGLNEENVSLNIKDASLNCHKNLEYPNRVLESARSSFWHNLIQRYDNQIEIEEDALSGLKNQIISFRAPTNQPAFEYVEDF